MMKKTILTGVASVALLLPLATACGEEDTFVGEDTGRLALEVDFKSDPISAGQESRATLENAVTADDLSLRLSATDGDYSQTWATISEFDPSKEFSVGTYNLEAFYGDPKEEGYAKPWFHGAQEVKVVTGKTTSVSLNVGLANSIVKVIYTDAFKEYMTAYEGTVRTSAGNEIPYDETNPDELYVAPGNVSIALSITKPNGKQGEIEAANFEAKPRYRHTVTVDYNGGETGGAEGLTVTFDETLGSEEFTIDISDDILTASAPVLTADGFASGDNITFVETAATPASMKVNIVARGKIGSVTLATTSAALTAAGWPETVDLAHPEADVRAKLEALGLSTLGVWNHPDVMGVVDFTKVLANIPYVDGADNTSVFTLTVADLYKKTCEPVTFSVSVEKLVMELVQGDILADGQLKLMMKYNGGNPEGVKFYAKNSRGTYTALITKSMTFNEAASTYEAELTHPANDPVINAENQLEVKAEVGSLSSTVIAKAPVMLADAGATNAYARHSTVGLKFTDPDVAAQSDQVEWYISSDNGATYTRANASAKKPAGRAVVKSSTYELEGLTPATTYMVYAKLGDEQTFPFELTTEAAPQLPNAGFDEWNADQKGDYQYLWYTADWTTMNETTISQSGSGSGNGLSTGGCAYKATSGTIPANGRSTQSEAGGGILGTKKYSDGHTDGKATLHSDKANSGANAALIRTVGWGSGNSAKASGSGFGTCQNLTPGELNLDYPFGSRPSEFSFYYHYDVVKSGNGDFGTADVKVFDASGNVIGSASTELTEKASYDKKVLPIDYTNPTAKASKITVSFKSSANPAALEKNTTYWRCPGAKNVSGGEYVGSELYVDDIELIY